MSIQITPRNKFILASAACSAVKHAVKVSLLALMAVTAFPRHAHGQETCSDAVIRAKSKSPVAQIASDDIYFNAGNSDQPIVGRAELEELRKVHLAERRNQQPTRFFPQRIVSSDSGDVAYDFGRAHVEYDVVKTGEHVSLDIEYLRVWKAVGGSCRLAASFSRPSHLKAVDR